MLKTAATALALVVGLASFPAAAQTFTGSCQVYCTNKACATAASKSYCISQCVPKCLQRNPKAH